MTPEEMISEFQCPGCTCGSAPADKCPSFELGSDYGYSCYSHSAGTFRVDAGRLALGLPKGFDRMPGPNRPSEQSGTTLLIRSWLEETSPDWDKLNVPVWAMEKAGFLFVRTLSPRTSMQYIDVIEKGTMELVPQAIKVEEFIDEID